MPQTREVLELLAEEIGARTTDPLASFTTWDEGRRKLDGMSRGSRWDIDREQRDWEKANAAELAKYVARQNWSKFEKAHPERVTAAQRAWAKENRAHLAAYRKRWALANVDKERLYGQRKHAARKRDPKRWAVWLARQERHKAKKRERSKLRYRQDLEASRARSREHSAAYYAKQPREGKRKCTRCGRPGHNRRRCGEVVACP